MNLLDTLDDLHGKATPGDWRVKDIQIPYDNGQRTMHQWNIETAYDHPQLQGPVGVVGRSITAADDEKYRYGVWLSADDAASIVAKHNAWPAILRALRAAEKVAAELQFYQDQLPGSAATRDGDTVLANYKKALEGLVKP